MIAVSLVLAAAGIDALAASFGTAHGIYKEKPKLDFGRIRKIRELTDVTNPKSKESNAR